MAGFYFPTNLVVPPFRHRNRVIDSDIWNIPRRLLKQKCIVVYVTCTIFALKEGNEVLLAGGVEEGVGEGCLG
jgi:hypothetical protein